MELRRTMLWMADLGLLSQEENREDKGHLHTPLKAPPSPSAPVVRAGGTCRSESSPRCRDPQE